VAGNPGRILGCPWISYGISLGKSPAGNPMEICDSEAVAFVAPASQATRSEFQAWLTWKLLDCKEQK